VCNFGLLITWVCVFGRQLDLWLLKGLGAIAVTVDTALLMPVMYYLSGALVAEVRTIALFSPRFYASWCSCNFHALWVDLLITSQSNFSSAYCVKHYGTLVTDFATRCRRDAGAATAGGERECKELAPVRWVDCISRCAVCGMPFG
jgi:hypothetical protein